MAGMPLGNGALESLPKNGLMVSAEIAAVHGCGGRRVDGKAGGSGVDTMVKNRIPGKDVGKKRVVTGDGESDLLGGLRAVGVGYHDFGNVGSLSADQRAGDRARCGIDRHPFGQRRIIRIRAHQELYRAERRRRR